MVCAILHFITILSVASGQVTPLYCSDVQSPASGSHNTDLSPVTTLQYCIVDNCTIMRIDTGQQLDIVYTTESLLIITPIDGYTSTVISKIDDELSCFSKDDSKADDNMADGNWIGRFIGSLSLVLLITMASGYVIIAHLLFKELRTLFGKLLILYNLCVISTMSTIIAMLLMHYWIAVNSQIVCHIAMIIFMIMSTGMELFAANILTHLAYIMYRCYNLKSEISNRNSIFLFRCYNAYAFITLILFFFLTIAYDWRTGNAKYTLLSNGHCNFIDQHSYKSLFLSNIFIIINKSIQIAMFLAYLVYYYKLKAYIRNAQIPMQHNQELFRIAITMGATIGLSHFIWFLLMFDPHPQHSAIISISGTVCLLVQQGVIMASFACTEKMSDLCKTNFSRERN